MIVNDNAARPVTAAEVELSPREEQVLRMVLQGSGWSTSSDMPGAPGRAAVRSPYNSSLKPLTSVAGRTRDAAQAGLHSSAEGSIPGMHDWSL
jgi:hypothetical protein